MMSIEILQKIFLLGLVGQRKKKEVEEDEDIEEKGNLVILLPLNRFSPNSKYIPSIL